MIFQDPISSLNPRRRIRDIVAEGLRIWGHDEDAVRRRGRRGARRRRPRPGRGRRPTAARVLGRAVPAHLPGPLARARPRRADLRRAGVGARRVGAGADPQPARSDEGPLRPDAGVHRPRPRGREEHQRPGGRHVPRQAVRGRPRRRAVPGAGPPVHPVAAGLDPAARAGDGAERGGRSGASCRRRSRRRRGAASAPGARARPSAAPPKNRRCVQLAPGHHVACHFPHQDGQDNQPEGDT